MYLPTDYLKKLKSQKSKQTLVKTGRFHNQIPYEEKRRVAGFIAKNFFLYQKFLFCKKTYGNSFEVLEHHAIK